MSRMEEEAARRKAQEIWGRKERRKADALSERQLAQSAEAAKTARLRELRLAREATEQPAPRKAAVPRRRASGPKPP
jgi:hypothetical protein